MSPDQDDFPHAVASTIKALGSKPPGTDDKFTFASATASVYVHSCSLRPRKAVPIAAEAATGGNGAP